MTATHRPAKGTTGDHLSAARSQPPDAAAILKAAAAGGIIGTEGGNAPRFLAVLCDPDVSADEVTELVGHDPALTLRVLRVANSAYYGQPRSIARIDRAVGLVGLDAVRGIAAAASGDLPCRD
jgi:hypothetical protein